MRNAKWSSHIVVSLFVLFTAQKAAATFTCTSIASGNWGTSTTWNCPSAPGGYTPVSTDTAIVNNGFTVTVEANHAAASLTVGGSGANTLQVASGVTLSVSGAVTVQEGLTGDGSILVDDGTLTTPGTITITGGISNFALLRINNGTVSVGTNISFVAGIQANRQLTFTGNGILNLNGNLGSAGTINPGSGTFNFIASSATINDAYTFYDFKVSKNAGSSITLASPISINHNLSILSGILADAANQITGNAVGTVTISGSSSQFQLGLTTSTTATSFPSFPSSSLSIDSTVAYQTNAAQSISTGVTYGNLILTTGTLNATKSPSTAATLNVLTDLTLTNGTGVVTLDLLTSALSVGRDIAGDGHLTVAGDVALGRSFSNSGAFVMSGSGTFTYTSAQNGTVRATSYSNLFIGGTGTKTLGAGAMIVAGDVTLAAGSSFDASLTDMQVVGNWSRSNTATFTPGSKKVTFTGAGGTISAANFYDLTFNGTRTAGGALDAAHDFVVTATGSFDAGTFTHSVGANLDLSGGFTAGSSTFDMKGASSGSVIGNTATFNNITFSGAGAKALANNEIINGTLTISNNLTVSPVTITCNGAFINNGFFSGGGSTIAFAGIGATSIGGTQSTTFDSLIVNKPSGTLTLNALTVIGTSLTLTNGIVDGTSKLAVGTSATITRTNGWISAPLQIAFPGSGTKTFPVGTTTYGPVDITVFMSGNVTVTPFSGLPPNLTGTNALTRYWTITGISVTNAIFYYQAADVNGGTEANYVAARYASPDWQRFATTINTGVHSATIGGFGSNSGTWAIGEPASLGLGVVTNNSDFGTGSLRQAIIDTNANAGTDTISFNITPAGAHVITLSAPLPTVTDPVNIDGSTQPGFAGAPLIILDGNNGFPALLMNAGNSSIRSLATRKCAGSSISLSSSNNTVKGCYLGIEDGTISSSGNAGDGLSITGANNTIGGTTAADRNVISGNQGFGVVIGGAGATGNIVEGNYIGSDAAGTAAFANVDNVAIELGASGNTIGGTAAGAGNVISASLGAGIVLFDSGTSNNLIQGNIIGLDATGTSPLSNNSHGVFITDIGGGPATSNTIGGNAVAARNVISANNGDGIRIETTGNVVQNNYVGTDAAGTGPQFNVGQGIRVANGGLGNKILDNKVRAGIQNAIVVAGNTTYGTWILDNLIQTTSGRQIDLGDDGADVNDSTDADSNLANNKQNYPVINNAVLSAGNLDVYFSADSSGSALANGLRIEVFKSDSLGNTTALLSSVCLGATLIYSNQKVSMATTGLVAGTDYVTATLTNYNNSLCTAINDGTSELAVPKLVSSAVACQVLNTADSGAGSLRQAILDANAGTCTTVTFNIAGGGSQIIQPLSSLPAVTRVYILDGRSQPGYSGTPIITIDGSSAGAGVNGLTSAIGSGSGVQIRGLVIQNFSSSGILVNNAIGGTTILGNYIGTNAAGLAAQANGGYGIRITGGTGHFIGSATAGDRNIISGNTLGGIRIETPSTSVQNNYIGVNAVGTNAIANGGPGITITSSTSGAGGTVASQRNVISGNGASGILITGASAASNVIVGNYIGTDVTGTFALPNAGAGIMLASGANTNFIGNSGFQSVTSGNNGSGILIDGAGTNGNLIQNNIIGLNATATAAIPNGTGGVLIQNGAASNTIGGTTASLRNIISGNTGNGLTITTGSNGNSAFNNIIGTNASSATGLGNSAVGVFLNLAATNNTIGSSPSTQNIISGNGGYGVRITAAGTTGNIVRSNFIGTNITSTAAVPNALAGVFIDNGAQSSSIDKNVVSGNTQEGIYLTGANTSLNSVTGNGVGVKSAGGALGNGLAGIRISSGANNNTIGGTSGAITRNIVSANFEGIGIDAAGADNNTVIGNFIGTDGPGTGALPNLHNGVVIHSGAKNNIVGGTTAAAANVIAFNTENGVAIFDNGTTGNRIVGNAIHHNNLLGIDLDADGNTANDAGDVDAIGGNNRQNEPVFVDAYLTDAALLAHVNVDSSLVATTQSIRVETFKADTSGTNAQANGIIGTQCIAGNNLSAALLNTLNAAGITAGTKLVATATSYSDTSCATANDGTSEMSATTTVVCNPPSPVVNASGPTTFCSGGSVTLSTTASGSYQWFLNGNPVATTASYTATSAGNYTLTVTYPTSCSASTSTIVTIAPAPNATITAPSNVNAGSIGNSASVASGPAGTTYVWTISGGTITAGAGTPAITFTAGSSGVVSLNVTVTNSASCSASGNATVAIGSNADLVLLLSGPSSATVGDALTYVVTIANNGPAPAQNLTVDMTISGGAVATSATGAGFNCSVSPSAVTCVAAALTVGGSRTITLITTSPLTAATITVSASVSAASTDPSSANNSASTSTTIDVTCPTNGSPALVAPADGATNVSSPVTFSWNAVMGATAYELWAGSGNASPVIVATTSATSATVTMQTGVVTWYVIARFGANCTPQPSAVRSFTIPAQTNCTHDSPQLIGPASDAGVTSPVTFSWNAVAGATDYRLWLTVDGSAPQDIGLTGNKTTFTTPLAGTKFTWYVDALFDGCPSTRSTTTGFTLPMIDSCADRGTATLIAPADGASLSSAIVAFKWNSVAGASGYRVWLAVDGGDFQTLGTATSATKLDAAVPAGMAEYYVETLFEGCASTESAHAHFTTPHAQECSNAKPLLIAPAAGVTLNNPIVDFSWEGVPNGITYEVWLSLNGGTSALLGTTTTTTLRHEVAAGSLRWFVRARVGGCSDVDSLSSNFTYAPPPSCTTQRPLIVAPADNAAVFSPFDLTWSRVPGAAQYRVWSARGSDEPSILTTTTATHINQQMQPGTYHLFVEAIFASCPITRSGIVSINVLPLPPMCAAPDIPVMRAASEASSGIDYVVRWNQIGNAAFYELQEAGAADFSDATTIPAFTTEAKFNRVNATGAPIVMRYRVRTVSKCESQRSLYSDEVTVAILPANPNPSAQVNQATPAEDPQLVTYTFNITGAPGQAFSAFATQPWLTVMPSQGMIPQSGIVTLTAQAQTSGLPIGANTASIQVTLGALSKGNVVANATSSTTTVSVNLTQPISPTPKSTPPPDALIIPAVAHGQGVSSEFESDVRISNTSPQLMKYQLTFTPTGEEGIKDGKQTTIEIDPGATVALDDVLRSWFAASEGGSGTLEVRPLTASSAATTASARSGLSNLVTFASSRLFSKTASGTFGQFIPAIPFANFAGRNATLTLPQIAQSSAFRTNLGLVEGSGEPATVLISVFGSSGQKLTEFTQSLTGGQHLQLNSFLAQKNVTTDNARVEVKVTSTAGKVTAYASVIDNLTSDPLLVSPINVPSGATRYVLTGVADLSGGAANWRSDVRILNAGSKDVSSTLTYVGGDGMTLTRPLDMKAGETKQFDNVLRSLFDLTNSGGALFIDTGSASTLVATARTYNDTGNGTYGQYIPAVTLGETAALGSRPLQLLQVEESSRIRTNVGVTEVAGKPATLEVTVVPPNSKVEAKVQIDIAANEFKQYSQLLKSIGLGETYNARVTVRVIDGAGRVTAYASAIDQRTQDPTYIPAQ